MDIINRCYVDYNYRLSAQSPMVSKTIISNMVWTQVIREKLEIKKIVNKENAYSFDVLVYTIIILNISGELIENLFFKDCIDKGTRFIENSVMINDIKKRCLNPEKGFYIGNLKKNDMVKISFKVLILASYLSEHIKNKSYVEYNYRYNIEKPPIRVVKESNDVITEHNKNLFKQIIVGNTIKIDTGIDKVITIECNAEVIGTKIINNFRVDFCNILILAKLKYKILYKSCGKLICYEDVFGFSEFILAPIGAIYLNNIDIKIKIEDISSELIGKKVIFLNSAILIYC